MRLRGLLFPVLLLTLATTALGESAQDASAAPSATLDFANGLYARKMYAPAISEYRKFIASNPGLSEDTASAYFRLADSYFFMKDYAKSIEQFEYFQLKFPEDTRKPLSLFRTGIAYYYEKNYSAASKAFSAVADTKAEDGVKSGALFYRAKLSEIEGALDKAIETLRGLTEEYPDTEYTTYACLLAGDIFAAQKKDEEALRAYQVVTERSGPEAAVEEAVLKTADLYFSLKRYPDARRFYRQALSSAKPASMDRVLTGLFYSAYQLKDLEEAKKLYASNQPYIKKSQARFDLDYVLSVLAEEKKDYVSALEALDRILKDPAVPEEIRAKALSARSYVSAQAAREAGKFEEALSGYTEVLKVKEAAYFRQALYQAGFLSVRLKKTADARDFFSKYIEKYAQGDEVERAALEKIQIDLDDELFAEAAEGAEKFLETYPTSRFQDLALYKLGMALTGQKMYDRSASIFEKISSSLKSSALYPDALYGAAASYDSAGNVKKAIEYYEKFSQGYPSHALYPDVMLRLGYLYVQDKDILKAVGFYENILLHVPQVPVESDVAFWVIRYDLDHGRYEKMKPILALLPERYPDETLTHEINFFLAESLMGTKNYAEAAKYYAKAMEAAPDGAYIAGANLGLGVASAAQGKTDEAETYFTKALAYESDVAVTLRARFEIANFKLKRGDLDEAAKAFMHVAILYDDAKYCPAALYKAGECFAKLGSAEESAQAYEELARRYPKSPWARKAAALAARSKEGVKNV